MAVLLLPFAPPARAADGKASAPAERAFAPQRPELQAVADSLKAGMNPYHGRAPIQALRDRLADGPTAFDEINLRATLSAHLLRLGENEAALEEVERALALSRRSPELERGFEPELRHLRAMVHLRRAEVANCIQRHNADCCIFPLRRGGVHALATPAALARQDFLAYLGRRPDDLQARWLLNLVSMAAGDHPQAVPAKYLIPASVFDPDADVGRFPDVAPALGVDTFNLAGGVIAEDFDRDGFLDIVTSTSDPEGPLTYYRSTGTGRFEDRSHASRLDDQLGGLNILGADYDNDGRTDILVLRGAWMFEDGRIRNSLLHNEGDGTFLDVTRRAGVAEPPSPTQAAAWADLDNDGDLDLYIGNESRLGMEPIGPDYPSQLFRNNGDGTFTDVAGAAGVANRRYAKGVTAGDYDNDGDVDLYVSNNGPNRLYRNNGDGTFIDVAESLGVTEPSFRSFAPWFFDYDNDGWLDLFVGAYDATVSDVAADYLGQPFGATPPRLYHNERGRFVDLTREVGLSHPYRPMGANFGDLDNDGFLDIYLGTGDPDYGTLMPNVMLRNDGGRRFQDVTTSGGFGHLQKGHGIAFADFDQDGDQDIYHQLGGFYPGDRFQNVLFRNPGHPGRFLTIELVGVRTNSQGLGARIRVVVARAGGEAEFHRAVGSVSSFGGSPMRQEIGLGDATAIRRLEIRWPVSGTTQVFEDVPLDAWIRVTEGARSFERVALRPFPLGP
jgi:hypothetical protein